MLPTPQLPPKAAGLLAGRQHFHPSGHSPSFTRVIFPKSSLPSCRCYLFRGCRQKLLDSLLGASTVQLFMPKVEVVTEGDHLHELYIVLAGLVETIKPGLAESAEEVALQMEPGDASHHGVAMSRYLAAPPPPWADLRHKYGRYLAPPPPHPLFWAGLRHKYGIYSAPPTPSPPSPRSLGRSPARVWCVMTCPEVLYPLGIIWHS